MCIKQKLKSAADTVNGLLDTEAGCAYAVKVGWHD